MPRPDLTETRTAQILDAFEACIAMYGLEGASLELIAQEAGVKRSIIRHYIGNREDLLVALTKRLIDRSLQMTDELVAALPKRKRAKVLIDYLFMRDPRASRNSAIAMDAVIAMSEQHPQCRELLRGFMESLVDIVSRQLLIAHPKAGAKRCWSVANGIMAIVFVFDSLDPLKLPRRFETSWKQNALKLLETLA